MLPFFIGVHGQEAEAALRGQRGRAGNAIQQRQARIACRREFVLRVVLIFRNQGQQKTDHCYPAALGRAGARRITVLAAVVPGLGVVEARDE